MKQVSRLLKWPFALLAGYVLSVSTPVHGFPSFHPSNCAGCHGNRPLLATPANGETLTFGSSGNTLVGQTSAATFTLKNNHTNILTPPSSAAKKGGGFTGSFPGAPSGTEFGPTTTRPIDGTPTGLAGVLVEYLVPQQSDSRTYTYTPQQRSLGVFDTATISFTPSNGFVSPVPTVTITLRGRGVAPQAQVNSAGANAGNVLVGFTGAASVQMRNVGDGNLSGAGDVSNLKGSFSAGVAPFTAAGKGFNLTDNGSSTQVYTFTPPARGAFGRDVGINTTNGSTNGRNQAQSFIATLSGRGVAPQVAVDTTQTNAGNVRIGTTGVAQVTVQNVGDGNLSGRGEISNLLGSFSPSVGAFAAAGSAINLADGAAQNKQYTFAPATRGLQSASINVNTGNGSTNGLNQAQTIPALLSGTGVGPVFASSIAPDSTIDFGTTAAASVPLTLSNATPDPDLGALTMLTLLSASITGPDATLFSLDGFTAGSQLAKSASLDFDIDFAAPPGVLGPRSATLTFLTDEGKALGVAANAFEFDLIATAVPEAGAWQMLGAGLVCIGLLLRGRSRARTRAQVKTIEVTAP